MRSSFRRALLAAALLGVALFGAADPKGAKAPPRRLWGRWVITKMLETPGISGISQREAQSLVGRRLRYSPTCAVSGATVVARPTYTVTVYTPQEFLRSSWVTFKDLGIRSRSVIEVDVSKPNDLGLHFAGNHVILRGKELVIEVENTYFVAVRVPSSGLPPKRPGQGE